MRRVLTEEDPNLMCRLLHLLHGHLFILGSLGIIPNPRKVLYCFLDVSDSFRVALPEVVVRALFNHSGTLLCVEGVHVQTALPEE